MGLDRSSRKRLLELARQAITERLEDRPGAALEEVDRVIGADQGAFVTLRHKGRLRGCIGNFQCPGPLAGTVREMACAAAFDDPRFPPLASCRELAECDLEISCLSPLEETDPARVEVGRHGVYIIKGAHRGVLLPQVPVEQGWDRETFLDQTCLKAGLSPGCWKEPGTRVLTFEAEVFGEED